jgi:hypothetical protein
MNAEEKLLIDVALIALIILILLRWRRNGQSRGGDMADPSGCHGVRLTRRKAI